MKHYGLDWARLFLCSVVSLVLWGICILAIYGAKCLILGCK